MDYPKAGTYGRAIIDLLVANEGTELDVNEIAEQVGCTKGRVAGFARTIEALPDGALWFGHDVRVTRRPPASKIHITVVAAAEATS